MVIPSKIYDKLKFIALVVIPAVVVFYEGLGALWGWGHTKEIVGSIALFGVFLGSVLQLSTKNFSKNQVHTGSLDLAGHDPDTGMPVLQMVMDQATPEEILGKKEVRLKVRKPKTSAAPKPVDPEEH